MICCGAEAIEHDSGAAMLHVGTGRVEGVTEAMWEYEVSGHELIRRWFARRKRDPDGRRSSPLDDIVARTWDSAWTTELIDLLNVIALLLELEPAQAAMLGDIASGVLITADDVVGAGVLPASGRRQAPEKPPRQTQL